MQLVNVTIFAPSFLLGMGIYKQCNHPSGTHQTHLGKSALHSSTRQGPPTPRRDIQCFNAFKNTKTQFFQSHNVPAAKLHVSAALTHEKYPDTRKQTLKVKQIHVIHSNMVTTYYAASCLRSNLPLSSMYQTRKILLMTSLAFIRIKHCSLLFSRKKKKR